MKKIKVIEIPHYCIQCGKCETLKKVEDNLKIKNNTGYTHDIYCLRLSEIVYRM